MKIIGWIGSIILAPFYFLFKFQEKIKLYAWPLIAGVISSIILAFINLKNAYIRGVFEREWYDIAWEIGSVILLVVILIVVTSFVSGILQIVLSVIGYPFIKAFTYTNAWRQGISKDELEGRLEYIRMQKEVQKQAAEAKKRQKKEDAFNKGFQDQARQSNSQNTYGPESSQNNTDQSSGSSTDQSYSDQNHEYKRSDESQNNYRTNSNNSSDYYAALNLFMLDEGYTMDELKKQRNRLLKSFHPDESSEETKKYAQKINSAYEILKRNL